MLEWKRFSRFLNWRRLFLLCCIIAINEAFFVKKIKIFKPLRITTKRLRGGSSSHVGGIHGGLSHNGPNELVKLSFECFDLKNKDFLSKSDPLILLFINKKNTWNYVGRTELVKNNLNPVFKQKILTEFTFEAKQPIRLVVLDVDNFDHVPSDAATALPLAANNAADAKAAAKASGHDLLGLADAMLADVVNSRDGCLTLPLAPGATASRGPRLRLHAEEIAEGARPGDRLAVLLRGQGLAAKDGLFGLSDPYLVFRRLTPTPAGGSAKGLTAVGEEVGRTEVVRCNLDPVWRELRIDLLELCGGDLRRPFRLECYDWDMLSLPDSIGDADVCVEDLLARRPLVLLDRKARPRMAGRCGTIVVTAARIERMPSLLDYLACGGCTVSLAVAVDFTASNGAPEDPTSLHRLAYDPAEAVTKSFSGSAHSDSTWLRRDILEMKNRDYKRQVHKSKWNEYQQALSAVGEVLVPYDSDGRIAAFGFGGIPTGAERASFCFALNGNGAAPDVSGVAGLLEAYRRGVLSTRLHGPTNMAEVVARVSDVAREQKRSPAGMQYHVLLILTDGAISDLRRTEEALAAAADLPMSVVIVGVCNAHHREDFAAMRELDADDASPWLGRRRDLVQFVPLDLEGVEEPEDLARRVLAEVPAQLVGYFAGLRRRRPAAWSRPDLSFYDLPPVNATREGVDALSAAAKA